MEKKYSCRHFDVVADYDSSLTYVGACHGHFEVRRLVITNTSGCDWSEMTVAITSDWIKPQIRVYGGLAAGASMEIVPDSFDVDMKRLAKVDSALSSVLRVTVADSVETIDVACMPIKVYGKNCFAGEAGHFEELAAFVEPENKLVGQIVIAAEINNDSTQPTDEFGALRGLVARIYVAVKDLDITYRDVFFRADRCQDIATSERIDRDRSGNGLDLALLMCGCLEKAGVRSSIIYFKSSVIVGAWLADVDVPETPVTAKTDDIYDLIAADRPQLVLVDPAGVATGKDFEDANYSANRLMLDEEPVCLIDIAAARKAGVEPMILPEEEATRETKAKVPCDRTPFIKKPAEGKAMTLSESTSAVCAVTEAGRGVSLRIDAPAGTCRDAVAATIMANASHAGRKVLYIAADDDLLAGVKKYLGRDDNGDGWSLVEDAGAADVAQLNKTIEKYYAIEGDETEMRERRAARMEESHAMEIADTLASLDDFTHMLGKHPSKLPLTGIYPRVRTSRGQARIEAFLEEFPRFDRRVRRRERSLFNRWFFHHDAIHYLERIEQWNTFRRLVVLDDRLTVDIDTISGAIKRWYDNRHLFADWAPFADAVVTLNRLGALDTLDYFLDGHSGKATSNAFLKGYYAARIRHMMKDAGNGQEASDDCTQVVENRSLREIPKPEHPDMDKITMMVVDEVTEPIPAQDCSLIIVDGAGRIPFAAAKDVIASAEQVIVIGDETLAEARSVLAEAVAFGLDKVRLDHISKPQHEHLAAFRSITFYDSSLFTFPSADNAETPVVLVNPSGIYDASNGVNETEAHEVIELIKRKKKGDGESVQKIGVVALTQPQCELIERLLKDIKSDAVAFVKGPDTLTGDEECDELIVSVAYAPDDDGRVAVDFGALARQGGEKIINKALSSPVTSMTVVSSLRPPHIPEDDAIPFGARVLRRFVAYSINPLGKLRGEKDKNDTCEVVKNIAGRLKDNGLEVDTNVGRGPFRIDVAVKDSKHPERYLFGVMVDCGNESALPARTHRDVIVNEILPSLGWKIHQVRAFDWFSDSSSVLKRLSQFK